jgi:hypothetical protein
MTSFKINENLSAVCEWKKTRNGFKHEATLLRGGQKIGKAKSCYLNRTWEAYEFQSVLRGLKEKTAGSLSEKELADFDEAIENGGKGDRQALKMLAGIAKLGEIFSQDKKGANDWKARMLKAGLGGKGLEMPEDWDDLSEETKEARLNGAIGILAE